MFPKGIQIVSINHFSFGFHPELIEGPFYFCPNPFPKQTHTKTHAGANIIHNLSLLRKKKKCLKIKSLFVMRIRIMTYCCCDTFPLFSKGHVSHQSSSHQVHSRLHVQRRVLSPCAFHPFPVPFVA